VVVDADGAPVANARVSAEPEPYDAASPRSATTDARGAFVVRGLGAAKYSLVASAESRTNAKVEIDIAHRDHDGLRLALGRGARIKGRVTDVGGAPISGVTVHVSGPSPEVVETSADGTFEATGLEAGEYRLGVRSDDAPRRSRRQGFRSRNGKSEEDKWVRVAAGATAVTTLVLERRADALEGVVVDARGAPLSDHFVEAQRVGRPGVDGGASASRYDSIASGAITDSLGRFRIDRLGAGEYHVRAFRPGGAEGIVARVSAGTKDVTVKVVSGAISGTVRAPRGVRPDRFHVSVAGVTHRWESIFHANGAFVLRELPPGNYDVTVTSAEGTATEKVTVAEDRTAMVTLSLEHVDATD
jgi:protocatechuate 3,4-dioxygenase beta subunit